MLRDELGLQGVKEEEVHKYMILSFLIGYVLKTRKNEHKLEVVNYKVNLPLAILHTDL